MVFADTLLNVSYDVSRELYKDINKVFIADYFKQTGKHITIDQSHNGSSKQARAVIAGLEADVVTMNQLSDMDLLQKAGLLSENWQTAFPNKSSPATSTTTFLVRKGNPKNIHDWHDLVQKGIHIVTPHPKSSGNGRYSYLAALAYATHHFKMHENAEHEIQSFMRKLYQNVSILDSGGRAATTTFIHRGIGDVLINAETEILYISQQTHPGEFEVINPSLSIQADFPVAIIEPVARKHRNLELAQQYIAFLFSDKGQEIFAAHYLRPINHISTIHSSNAQLAPIKLITVDELGGWDQLMQTHFSDGGLFDQIYSQKN